MGNAERDTFAVKVGEIRSEYERYLSGMELLKKSDIKTLDYEIQVLCVNEEKQMQTLRRVIREARSPAVLRLAAIEVDYLDKMRNAISEMLPELSDDGASGSENNTEALALCTEYAMDFATDSLRCAYLFALQTVRQELEA